MANCPNCSNPIDEDFGFVTCGSCGFSVMLDMDGNPVLESAQTSSASSEEVPPPLENSLPDEPIEESSSFLDEPVQVAEFSPLSDLQSGGDEVGATGDFVSGDEFMASEQPENPFADFQPVDADEPSPEPYQEAALDSGEETPIDNWDLYGESNESVAEGSGEENLSVSHAPTDSTETPVQDKSPIDNDAFEISQVTPAPEAAIKDSADFSDVLDFANDNKQNQQSGQLYYSIYVAGIDTPDIKSQVKEALEDKKFVWDVNDLLSRVEEGRLRISGLGATKAMIIVKRLKILPLQIKWEQHDPHN